MDYMLLLYLDEAAWPRMSQAEQESGRAAYSAYMDALTKAGMLKGSGRLQPTTTATTVRISDARSKVLDGPYTDSKEQLGGYFMIEAPDLDAALAWAARCPAASHGVVEVRPIWGM